MDARLLLVAVSLLLLGDLVTSEVAIANFTADPAEGITEGQNVLLTCQVSGSFDDDYNTLIIKETGDFFVPLASKDGKEPGAPENVQHIGWIPNKAVFNLYVSITNIARVDRGNYACHVLSRSGNSTTEVLAQKTIAIDVEYVPSGKPSCDASPFNQTFTYYDGDKVSLKCTADAGNPEVPIHWPSTGGNLLPASVPKPEVRSSGDDIVSILLLTMSMDYDGVSFTCARLNNDSESCRIGPFTILNKTLEATYTKATDETPWLIPVIAVAAGTVLVVIIVIIFFLGKSQTTKKPRLSKADIELQPDYEKLKSDDPQDNLPTNNNGTTPKNDKDPKSIKSKPKGKTYPDPPAYPRPPKNVNGGKNEEKPYENAEIGSPLLGNDSATSFKYPEETKSAMSPNTEDTKKKQSDKIVYANTLDVGSGVSKNSAPPSREHLPPPELPDEVNDTS